MLCLDPISQITKFEQDVKHIIHGKNYAFGMTRMLPNGKSLFLDGNDIELVEAILQNLDVSSLGELAFNKPWLNTIATNLISPSRVINMFNFIVPKLPQGRKKRGRLLTKDDYDVVMCHETLPVRAIGGGLKKAFEEQLRGNGAQTFGIIEGDYLVSWVRMSPAYAQFWKVDMMWTVPEHRQKGYCSGLLLTAIHEFRLRNRQLFIPDVEMGNFGSLAVWQSLQVAICATLTIYQAYEFFS